jgi:hypothetical protein
MGSLSEKSGLKPQMTGLESKRQFIILFNPIIPEQMIKYHNLLAPQS